MHDIPITEPAKTGIAFNKPLVEAAIHAVCALARDQHANIRVDAHKGSRLHSSITRQATNPSPLIAFAHSFDQVPEIGLSIHLGDISPTANDERDAVPSDFRILFGFAVRGPNGGESPLKFGAHPFIGMEGARDKETAWDLGQHQPPNFLESLQAELGREAGNFPGAKVSTAMRIPGTADYSAGRDRDFRRIEPTLISCRVIPSEVPSAD